MKITKKSQCEWKIRLSTEDEVWQQEASWNKIWQIRKPANTWRPPTDVLELDEAFVVIVEVAGMRGLNIQVTYDREILSIRGCRIEDSGTKVYHQMEIDYGEFLTSVHITASIETSLINASYHDGFLTVSLPKVATKKISIS